MSQSLLWTCPFCSLHCDDLQLEIDGGHLAGMAPACALAEAGFRRTWPQPGASSQNAMREAGQRIKQARRLLVAAGGEAGQAAVEAAYRLAEAASADLLAADPVDESLALAMKSNGLLTATLRDLRSLAAQVVLLDASPETCAPRLWHFIGAEKQASAITLPFSMALETLRFLRLHTRRDSFQPLPDRWISAARQIEAAPSGVVIFGPPAPRDAEPLFHELLGWLEELNRVSRWYGLYLPRSPNTAGITEALLSLSGISGKLHFTNGGATDAGYELHLETAVQESDVILLTGGGRLPAESWPVDCQQRAILLSPSAPGWKPGLWLPVAQPGLDAPACMLRLDGLPVELEPLLPGKRPSTALVLEHLAQEAAE